MSRNLVQRHGMLRRTYVATDDGIRVSERSLSEGRTLTIPYEVLFANREEVFTASKHALWTAIVLAVLAVLVSFHDNAESGAGLFWGTFAAIAGAYYWASRRDQIEFSDGETMIRFLKNKPTAAELDGFLTEARERGRKRIRAKLLPLVPTGDALRDRHRAAWLHDKGLITDGEYAAFDLELLERSLPAKPGDHTAN